MEKLALGLGAVLLAGAPALAHAQTWSAAPLAINATAVVHPLRQVRTDNVVHLDFGSDGVTPGVSKTVAPTASDPATGTSAKVDVRFNAGTRVTVAVTRLDNGTYNMTPSYTCVAADDRTGATQAPFPCDVGYVWPISSITGMMQRSVLVGATLPAAASLNVPAGTYTGTLTLVVASGSS